MTVIPERPTGADTRPHRRTRQRGDAFAVSGAAVASLSATALLFTYLTPFTGTVGFIVVAYLLFLACYTLLTWLDEPGPAVRDRLAGVAVHSLGFLVLAALIVVVGYTFAQGAKALPHANFFTADMSVTGPLDPLTMGGILHAAIGTLEQMAISLAITVPLGITCAVYLSEVRGPGTRFVRTVVEAMTALPSIVAGLFVFAAIVLVLGFGKSGFAASLAISVMMLPIIIRAADVVLRLVPRTLREASLTLGASQWRTVWHVVLPTARSGLTTSVILGAARGIGETSPVLLTAGFTKTLNADPFSGPQISLPLATYEFTRSPEPSMVARGFGTAAALMALVLVLFVIARLIGGRGAGHLSARQARARTRSSARDARRFTRDGDTLVQPTVAAPPPTTTPPPPGASP
ncbi:phosphate transport system permease protein PstA [Actinorhabdospora filicis]|uniref:Phosphate transport system permease protein PstA n=1 Tax=Actinorhabdospora filicis TaxID=1785913 RepID=A0A9W6SH13_9ACTN|nr:phosphate ABC transporter permease PstA [Actinorhabdospora filicis]GLZ75707.1 phosphate transport system permease protein PstA [Actinorhabdospora filicis]